MRHALVILLLVAAAVHPFAHLTEESVACPCVHGAMAELAPPALDGPAAAAAPQSPFRSAFVPSSVTGEIPARAPPAAV